MISPPLPVHLDCKVGTQAAVAVSTFWTSGGKAMCWFDLLRTWVACEASVRWSGARRMRVVMNFGIELRMDGFEIATCHHLTLSNPAVSVQHLFCRQDSGVPRGGLGCSNPPQKFRSFDKAEPNSQFRGKYIRNNLTRIRLSLIFWVVAWKALPASYDPPQWYFFFSPRHDVT